MKCTNCGKDIPDNSLFCNYCGLKFEKVDTGRTDLSQEKSHGNNRIVPFIIVVVVLIACLCAASYLTNHTPRKNEIHNRHDDLVQTAEKALSIIEKYNTGDISSDDADDALDSVHSHLGALEEEIENDDEHLQQYPSDKEFISSIEIYSSIGLFDDTIDHENTLREYIEEYK